MDELEKFCNWFLNSAPVLGYVPFMGAVGKIQDVVSVTMYKKTPFQVQMFIVPPNYIIPEHKHPNVDNIQVYMGGDIRFSHSGVFISEKLEVKPNPKCNFGTANLRGYIIRVRPNDLHGGVFGEGGGVFLSIQHWLNGIEPHCVAADYQGIVMGEEHLKHVKSGIPILKHSLNATDAASEEKNLES